MLESASFKLAMRNVPGSVSIVSTGLQPERHGLTLTAGCSLSTDPCSVLVCVNKSAGAHDTILRTGQFCWNILAADHIGLANTFAGLDGSKGDARFEDGRWTAMATGAPVLNDALCCFDCKVIDVLPAASHTIFIGAVLAERHRPDPDPLLYLRGAFAVPHAHQAHSFS